MKKLSFIVTAGPTREYIDPFRFISNPSTGKMGYEIALRAGNIGYDVLLISGPTQLSLNNPNIRKIDVVSAQQMCDAVLDNVSEYDVLIMAAAVSDYRPKDVSPHKIKKSESELIINLEKNKDILEEVGKTGYRGIKVGFAAETENIRSYALDKLQRKKLNMIVANDITQTGAGFASETNVVTIFSDKNDIVSLPVMPKSGVARFLINYIVEYIGSTGYVAKDKNETSSQSS